jgi:DNA primase
MWRCFGSCNEGGDIFSFVQKIDGATFPEAVEMLAEKAGVKLEKRSFEKREETDSIFSANDLATDFYSAALRSDEGKKALDYLKKRKITDTTIKEFSLGYSPTQKHSLQKDLAAHKIGLDDLEKAGLATKKQGEYRDFFWGRLMFPIKDITGRTIGFSARVLDDSLPKYINTGETPVYHKSNALYGIDLAKETIRKSNNAIIVEGMMDVIASHQAGVKNVVAPGGTALTENQLKMLGRLTKNLKLAFDVDFAGSEATKRAIELAWEMGFNLKVITIPKGKDPADAVNEDPKIWLEAVKKSKYVVDYLFDAAFSKNDKNDPMGRKYIAKDLLPIIKRIPDEIEQNTYIKKLAEGLTVDESSIVAALNKVGQIKPTLLKPKVKDTSPQDMTTEFEEGFVGLLIELPVYLDFAANMVTGEDFTAPSVGNDFDKVLKYYYKKGEFSESAFLAKEGQETKDRFGQYLMRAEHSFESLSNEDKEEEIFKAAKRLKKLSIEKKKRALTENLSTYEKTGQKDKAAETLKEIAALMAEEGKIS